jgi:hypothetical protein
MGFGEIDSAVLDVGAVLRSPIVTELLAEEVEGDRGVLPG